MDPLTLLPIRPTSPTLSSHLSALDKTISQLDLLPSQTKWPAYIPLTSRARIQGQIIHPNEVKVDLGDGWWVEMTASEAAGYLKRRKIALLEAQAKLLEGGKGSSEMNTIATGVSEQLPPPIRLNSLFMGLESLPSSSSSSSKSKPSSSATPKPIAPITKSSHSIIPQSLAPIPSSSTPRSTADEPDSLEAILEKFVSNEKSLMEGSQSGGKEVMTNEEGLPIRDICETPEGELISTLPESELADEDLVSTVEMDKFDKEAFDDPVAIARRKANWERVFGKDDDEEEEESDEEKIPEVGLEKEEEIRSISPIETESEIPATISSRTPTTTPNPTPRGILKPPPPQTRKKSVTFDPTVPLPPDSPDPIPSDSRRMGFDMALNAPGVDDSEFGVRPVPVIAVPIPGKKTQGGFGGMKRGFLDPPSGGGSKGAVKKEEKKEEVGGKKKPSLFAQRMASSVVKESPMPKASSSVVEVSPKEDSAPSVHSGSGTGPRKPTLPTMSGSATSATNTLRSSVIEKPTPTPPAQASSSKLHTPSSSQSHPQAEEVGLIDDDDYHSNLDEDEEEEEDEYDLDDALLAREVALEYHRRRAYSSPYIAQDPDDPGYGYMPSESSDSGGVMLAIPSIDNTTGAPTIINPTPDDFRRFVRVGKLENGNLVLAPGEEGWSDDEDDDAGELEIERRRKRDNRNKMKEALLGRGDIEDGSGEKAVPRGKGTIGNIMPEVRGAESVSNSRTEEGLPPAVVAAPKETAAPAVGAVKERRVEVNEGKEEAVEQPKKVSRFKAARMGGM